MKIYILTVVLILGLVVTASSAILLYEPFNYNAGENLDDQVAWEATGKTADEAVVQAGNLGVASLEPPDGNLAQLYLGISDNEGTLKWITYDAGGRTTNEALYISFALRVSDVGTLSTNNTRFLCFYRKSTYNGLAIRQHNGDSDTFDIAVGEQVDDTPKNIVWDDNGGLGYSEGSTVFIVYGVDDVVLSGPTDLKCWINPDPGTFDGTAPTPTMTTRAKAAAVPGDSESFRLGCGNGATVYIDELRVGESYADVTPADSTPRGTYFLID